MLVLGIETSCDETGIAIFDAKRGLIANVLHSQIELHQQYGGVVPELASRDHVQRLIPLLDQALAQAGINKNQLDAIAYTAGPGLIGALLVGTTFAKSLSYALKIPAVAVHHMEGHLLAPMLEDNKPPFPFIALLVSGGHTMLVKVTKIGSYEVLGSSIDDAAGEAFDKTAKLLGLKYPGGPAIAALAKQGVTNRFVLPRPLTKQKTLQFSFSGLKTAVLHTFNKTNKTLQDKADIALAFQDAVVDTLAIKCSLALKQQQITNLVIAGGVGANIALRSKLQQQVDKINGQLFYPRIEFCTDNGAMIAYAGYQRLLLQQQDNSLAIEAYARWELAKVHS